jgi:membrane protein implicated in regulation of membrane protease activity
MADWVTWAILAGVLVVLELVTGTFYLLMISIGMIAGALAAGLGIAMPVQILAASVVALIATYLLRHSRLGKIQKTDAARDPNVNLDIGQTVKVDNWSIQVGGAHTARVMYRGAQWDVELAPGIAAEPGQFIINEVRGSRLIVSK